MRRFVSKLTYTNVIGTLALFIALGGVSWAATLPKNSVGTDQLKKNAVTAKAIKDKSITGGDFKNDTIKGTKINLGSLGTVPKASTTSSADSVGDQLQPVVRRVAPSSSNADAMIALHTATDVPLLSNGSVSLVGKCFKNGTNLVAYIVARSATDGTIASFSSGPPLFGTPYLNAGKPDELSYASVGSAGANTAGLIGGPPYIGTGVIFATDAHGIGFQVGGFLKNGTLPTGDGSYGAGDVCEFVATGAKF